MTTYMTKAWKKICSQEERLEALADGFGKYLRECARPKQIAYSKLMQFCKGQPLGIECKSPTRDAWAFVAIEMSSPEYQFRVQNFDEHGFSGHFCYKTMEDAAEGLITDGYSEVDHGALERLSGLEKWHLGVIRSEIRTLFNRKLISYEEMINRFNGLTITPQKVEA